MGFQRLFVDDHDTGGAVADLAGGCGGDDAVRVQQLDARHGFVGRVVANAFVAVMRHGRAILVMSVNHEDFIGKTPSLGRGNRTAMGLQAERIELLAREPVFVGNHLRARKLAEPLDAEAIEDFVRPGRSARTGRGRASDREAHRHAGHALDAGGDHNVLHAGHNRLRREMDRLLRGTALAVYRDRRNALRKRRSQHRGAADMRRLFADLADAAHDHIIDRRRVDRCAPDEFVKHGSAQIGGMPVAQPSISSATGSACRRHDIGLAHICHSS